MDDTKLLKATELAIGLEVGEPTPTAFSVTGEPYVTMTSGGIKTQGDAFPAYDTVKAFALEKYLKNCGRYRLDQERKAGGPCVLYWRRHPELERHGKRGYVVTSRMLISDKPPLADEPSDTHFATTEELVKELPPLADGDWTAHLNARNFIEKVLKTNPRISVTDGGVGPSSADLGITIDGAPFSIRITPRPLRTDKEAYPEGDGKGEVPCE